MVRRLLVPFVLGALLFAAAACDRGDPTTTDDDYDRSCDRNADCAVVWTGSVCTCDNVGAVNRSALQDYRSERTDLQDECSVLPGCQPPSKRWRAVCTAGTCVVDRPLPDVSVDTGGDTSDTAEGDASDTEADDTTGDTSDTTDAGDDTMTPDDTSAGDADAAEDTSSDARTDTTGDADGGPTDTTTDTTETGVADTADGRSGDTHATDTAATDAADSSTDSNP